MKEKIFKKGITRRLFSTVLALAMVFSLLQGQNLVAYAATEHSVTITAVNGTTTYTESPITLTCAAANSNGIGCLAPNYDITVSASGDNIITKIEATVSYKHYQGNPALSVNEGSLPSNYSTSEGSVITISGIDASSVTLSNTDPKMLGFNSFVVYYKATVPDTSTWPTAKDHVCDLPNAIHFYATGETFDLPESEKGIEGREYSQGLNGRYEDSYGGSSYVVVAGGFGHFQIPVAKGWYYNDESSRAYKQCSGKHEDNGPADEHNIKVPAQKEEKNFAKGSLVSTPKELLSAIELTEDEKLVMDDMINLNIWTEITKQEASSIQDADKQKITAKLPATYSVGTYLDIKLKAQLDQPGRDERTITKTNKKVKIKINVPTELQKAGRTYDIIRLHDGEATVLGATREGYDLTFETDGFSTYALIYTDAAPAAAPVPAPKAPKTGDTSNMPLVMFILAMSVVGLGFTSRKKITK